MLTRALNQVINYPAHHLQLHQLPYCILPSAQIAWVGKAEQD